MIALYVLSLTVGLVLIVPTLFRAIDQAHSPGAGTELGTDEGSESSEATTATNRPTLFGFVAFATTVLGISGLVITRFEPGSGTNFIAALTLGLAAGAIHPEVITVLERHKATI